MRYKKDKIYTGTLLEKERERLKDVQSKDKKIFRVTTYK